MRAGARFRVHAVRELSAALGAELLEPVSYTHLRAHETVLDIVCRLLLEKKKNSDRYIHGTWEVMSQDIDTSSTSINDHIDTAR